MTITLDTRTAADRLLVAGLRHGLLLADKTHSTSRFGHEVATVELLNLGYLVRPEDLDGVSDEDLARVIEAARQVSGQDQDYRPMYPNFPAQVRGLDTLHLLIDQVLHYLTGGTPLVDQTVEIRPDLPVADLLIAAKPLRVTDRGGLALLARAVLAQPMACSEQDIALVTEALRESVRRNGSAAMPVFGFFDGVNNRENRQTGVIALAEAGLPVPDLSVWAFGQARNADELLRYVLALYARPLTKDTDAYRRAVRGLSDRDYRAVAMGSMHRAVRRALVARLGEVTAGNKADQLVSRTRLWRTVMRYVHPYAEVVPGRSKAAKDQRRALDIIHGNVKYRTYASRVEAALESGRLEVAVPVLEESAGQLYRSLAKLSTLRGDMALITGALERVGHLPAMTTLLSAYNGLSALATGRDRVLRVGGRANVMLDGANATASKADAELLRGAVREAMVRKIAAAGPVLDAATAVGVNGANQVELVRRDASVTDRAISRGERIPLPGHGTVLRLFVQWFNGSGRVDLDLGAILLDADFTMVSTVDYASYHGGRSYATFSGDLVDAPRPHGAAEFIDIDLSKVRKAYRNAEWVAMSVNSYTGQRLDAVEHFAGAMVRSDGDAGEVFDPRTVTTAFTSTSMATLVAPLAVNLRTRELLWIDTSNGQNEGGFSVSRGGSLADAIAFEVGVPRLTEGELAELYARAHGLATADEDVDPSLVSKLVAL